MKRLSLILPLLLWAVVNSAQTLSPEQTGGVYYAYPVIESEKCIFPDGFDVFYISHYGRHGSRWLPDEQRYTWVLQQFEDDSRLTPLGKDVKKRLQRVWKNAKGNAGQLTKLGARQHRLIAQRMAANYPQVFDEGAKIRARSSTVPRCRASMLAFCSQLPYRNVTPETRDSFMLYINNESDELKALSKRTKRQLNISTDRFINSLFNSSSLNEDERKTLLSELHTIASDMQDIPMKLSFWDLFTQEEMMAVYAANNQRMTIINGLTPLNDGIPSRSSVALWRNIEQEADSMITAGSHGASLRFGHDTALFRLLTLLQLSLPGNGMEQIIPMAANLQMIFARNAKGEVLIQLLHNEKRQKLPIPSFGNSYRWEDVKAYMHNRIHDLEHLKQLAELNTMVGTAPSNTRSAGIFGKGSEEHGQTLPAVLVPHGQTFWTPQTRDTEKKCVATYYYTDSLFQGFRASHWLVGGCTQDYGSFTVAAISGKRRFSPAKRATRFSHADEVSHPYYYKVYLPDEQLTAELTSLSHSAILRVTPTHDGPIHIVLNTNSDEDEGYVRIDSIHHVVYACNPVHRIYQGWGEPAGFSGHFILKYDDEMDCFQSFHQGVCLTFSAKKGQLLELRMATSFTGEEGAKKNLNTSLSFEEMMTANIQQWAQRFHTIDIADDNTDKVNQFYGALYRASFLPREMSDIDGRYPTFAGTTIQKGNARKHYGDFSMWDTYRALHPLLNIIDPQRSSDMMQSLVDMYQEGGWLPIFPCWNSYTAAMIGDHCASVLADAYVKGIRNFNIEKAYEGMLKNAMKSPKNEEDYKNGMGRRALKSYLQYGYIPMEDSVKEAYHTDEQTSRTLEYAYDDFCVAQIAKLLGHDSDYQILMKRSENWRNVINPQSCYADGRHANGSWENNMDLIHRKSYITEGATCHYTWYVPQNIKGLIQLMGGKDTFISKLDSMFSEGRYWHGNEPCHQVAWLFSLAGKPEKTIQWVRHILETEYNNTPGGLSGNDDAGQMSAWLIFAMMGFYPVCPAATDYALGAPSFKHITLNLDNGKQFVISKENDNKVYRVQMNDHPLQSNSIQHEDIVKGGHLKFLP